VIKIRRIAGNNITIWEMRNPRQSSLRNPERKGHLGDTGEDGRIFLIGSKKQGTKCGQE
jgi:hypothetical protein